MSEQLTLNLPEPDGIQLGRCKVHGQVVPVYEGFLGTHHCPVCGEYVAPWQEEKR